MARLAERVAIEYQFLFWVCYLSAHWTSASYVASLTTMYHDIQIINNLPGFRVTHYPSLKIFNPESRDKTGIRIDQLRLVRLNSRDGIIYFPEIIVVQV